MREVRLDLGKPNPLQRQVLQQFRDGKRIVLMAAGRQAGKSAAGARWTLGQIMRPDAKSKLGGVVAPTFRMARVVQRKLDEVLQSDVSLWKRIKVRKQPIPTYQFPNGWMLEVHSSDDPDSLRGPTFDFIWYDEVAKGSKESFDIIMPTLLASDGKFLGTTTARGKQNWIYKSLYLKSLPPGHPEYDADLYNPIYGSVVGSTWDNVENLSEDAVAALEDQYGKGSAYWRQEVAGEFVSFEGLVYEWDENNFVPVSACPERSEFSTVVGGLDFGWTDPAAAGVMGYKDGQWWVLDGFYESHMEPNDMASELAALTNQYKVERWFADSSRPDSIADLQARGIPVVPVVKPLIEDRIREMAMFTDNNRFKVSYRMPFLRDELQAYQYPEEDKLLRDRKRNPIDKNNHILDATGYALFSMRYLWRNDPSYRVEINRTTPEDDPDNEARTLRGRPISQGKEGHYGPAGLSGE